jgi:uracil-DNA glycosylase family 4
MKRPNVQRRAILAEPDCSKCPLRRCGIKVPAEGDMNADIAFVGMGPGGRETEHGRPFIGPSGQLLDKALGEAGLERSDVWVSNVSCCEPMPVTIDGKYHSKAVAEKLSMQACRSHILAELAIVKPKVVVAVGKLTMEMLTDDVIGVTKLQGSLNRLTKDAGLDPAPIVIPVFHPAHLLRGEMRHYPQVVAGFKKAKRIAAEGPSPPAGRIFAVSPTSANVEADLNLLDEIVDDVLASGVDVALDVETTEKDPLDAILTVIGFAADTTQHGRVSVPVTVRMWDGTMFVVGWLREQWDRIDALIVRLLAGRNRKWLWNYGYDYTVLERHYNVRAQLDEILSTPGNSSINDGMILHHLCQPDSLHGLDFVAHTELDIPPWKYHFRRKEKAGVTTHDDLLTYNAQAKLGQACIVRMDDHDDATDPRLAPGGQHAFDDR